MSGDFCLTMDRTDFKSFGSGKFIITIRMSFIGKLMQNAIDGFLLRKMEKVSWPERSRIDCGMNDKEEISVPQ